MCGVVCVWCVCGVYGDVFVCSCVVNENRVYTHKVLLTNTPGSSRWRTSDVILQGWGDQEEIINNFHYICSLNTYRSHNGEILSLGWFGEEQEISEEEHTNYHL